MSTAPNTITPGVPLTFEQAATLDPDRYRGEIVDGVWVPVPKSTWRHGVILLNIAFLLKLHARANPGLSVAAADPGVKLSRDPDVLRGPDVAVVRADRVPTGKGVDGWLDGAKAVWVVDPDPRQVAVITARGVAVLDAGDVLDGGDALPGFSCTVGEFFA